MKNKKLREWAIIVSIFLIFTFVIIGIKTVYEGNYLDKDYWFSFIILISAFIPFYFSKNNKKDQISSEVAEAMASKIKFEAEEHRNNRDSYNFVKIAYEEEV